MCPCSICGYPGHWEYGCPETHKDCHESIRQLKVRVRDLEIDRNDVPVWDGLCDTRESELAQAQRILNTDGAHLGVPRSLLQVLVRMAQSAWNYKVRDDKARLVVAQLRQTLQEVRWRHEMCEDGWYSCPKCPEGCLNDAMPKDKCSCGADYYNKIIDVALAGTVGYGFVPTGEKGKPGECSGCDKA